MTLPPPLPIKKPTDRASIWQLVLGVIGITMSLLSFLGLLLLSHLPAANTGSSTLNSAGITPLLWMTGLLAVLAVPSILFASRSIHDHPSPLITVGPRFLPFSAIAVVLWAALAYIGENAARWKLSINITSPLNILIVAIPILLLLTLGLYRLTFGSQQRAWGMINVAAFLTMQVVFFLEMIVILIVVVLAGVWLFKQPQFASYLSLLMTQKNITVQSLAPLFNQLTTLLNQPGLYAVVVLVFCLLVPMIEEGFKPLGVWLIAGKKLTPTQGFAAGLLSGATFGLLESLSLMSMVSGSTWLVTAVARIGTGLLHTLTAGLSGWALANLAGPKIYPPGADLYRRGPLAWVLESVCCPHGNRQSSHPHQV
jgi:hypothetical protein